MIDLHTDARTIVLWAVGLATLAAGLYVLLVWTPPEYRYWWGSGIGHGEQWRPVKESDFEYARFAAHIFRGREIIETVVIGPFMHKGHVYYDARRDLGDESSEALCDVPHDTLEGARACADAWIAMRLKELDV